MNAIPPHMCIWKPTDRNYIGIIAEQVCVVCESHRHHLEDGLFLLGKIEWMDGRHPFNEHEEEL